MSKITDYPFSFRLLRNYLVFSFKQFFSEYIVVGKENIPINCPIIFAPNHINAFMDAIAVHSIAPKNLPVIFLARADIFKNKTSAKILKFLKIMPAFRMRDGMENLGKNQEVFEQCVEILHENKALGIMPEGYQGDQQKLRPLVKGIFRIAFDAQQKFGFQDKVKIIPVGINYGDLVKYGKHIIINIGKPIEVSEYMNIYAENPVIATNEIRKKLWNDLNELTLNLETENHYECFETVCEVANAQFVSELNLQNDTISRFKARQEIAKKLVSIEKNEPEKIEKLETLCKEYEVLLKILNLRNWVLEPKKDNTFFIIIEALKLIVTTPFFLLGFLLNFLPFYAPVYIRKKIIRPQYRGFYGSLHFVLGIITFPLFYVLQTSLIISLINTPWWVALLFLIIQYPLGLWAIKGYKKEKKFMAMLRLKTLIQKKSFDLNLAQSARKQIIRMIS